MEIDKKNWFEEWFDSEHYHLLYEHRDYKEAELFITNLFKHLKLDSSSKVLDLACGKGRHALQVHQIGYEVIGVDLSEESIQHAKKYETTGLSFRRLDMRKLGMNHEVDVVLNLFTSFGYFQKEGDNRKVLESVSEALKPEGLMVLDYLNVVKVKKQLPQNEQIDRGEVQFKVKKYLANNFIVKDIYFEDKYGAHTFQEYVKCIDYSLFLHYFKSVGMEVIETFGNYDLEPYDEKDSDRLILVVKKIAD
ncbi:MAG: class I SAM-dependent methyltransferase [Vicingaceae bacterium]